MEETFLLNHPGVKKKILCGGSGPMPHCPPGTKLVFNFQTLLDDFERTVIDDSRLAGRPAEIFVGKMFKMEVWETLLTSMRTGEVAEFWCDAVHTGLYPIVSKGMRLIAQGKDPLEGQRHMCGMGNMFHYHTTGFPELDELMRTPQPLIFIMELLQVGDPMSYQRESWMMEKDEKLQMVPVLHMQGNALVKLTRFREAASKYKEAVLLLRTVQSREMPGDMDYINLGRMIIPLELNYCQCMLELQEFYEVIEHTTELLDKHKDLVKGYYKRAKAHAAVWNEKEARRDFNMVARLDVTLASLVGRELKALSERMKEKYWEEKEKYWNMLETKEDKDKEGEEGEGEEEEEEEGKQPDSERETTESKEEVGEEKGKGSASKGGPATVAPGDGAGGDEACHTEGKDWQQMLRLVMLLQNEGNFLIKGSHFQEARGKFTEALEYVDFLQNKVDQQGEDWESLEKVRLPLTLNLSQCLLELSEHQQVVELVSRLLKKHRGNFKAVYQRAQAHAALLNEDAARRDFETVERVDPQFKPFVRQELKKLGERIRTMHACQHRTYRDTTQEKWGPGGSKTKAKAAAGKKKKNVQFAQEASEGEAGVDQKTAEREMEEKETEGVDHADTKRGADVEAERSHEELGGDGSSEEALDTESVAGHQDGQRAADEDSDPASTGTGDGCVVSGRRASDTVREEVACQSSAEAEEPGATSRGDRAAGDKAGNGGTQSE